MTDQTWNSLLREQLARHWTSRLRDRLDGPADDEYCWEPVPGCWNVIAGVLAARNAAHFGRAPAGYQPFEYAPAAALDQLDAGYAAWPAGVGSPGETGPARPCGQAEEPYAERPLAAPVLNIDREPIHHLAEVCLPRDLYPHTHREAS